MARLTWFDPTDNGIQLVLTVDGKIENAGFVAWGDLPNAVIDIVDTYVNVDVLVDTGELSIAEHIEATCRPLDWANMLRDMMKSCVTYH